MAMRIGLLGCSDVRLMMAAADGEGGGGAPAPAEPAAETTPAKEPAPSGGGDEGEGDEGLPAGESLIGDGAAKGETPPDGEAKPDPKAGEGEAVPEELSEEDWLAKVSFTEALGKGEKGEPLALNREAVKPFVPVLRELGLDPAGASKLVTAYAKIEAEQTRAREAAAEQERKAAEEALLAKRDELRAQAQKALTEDDLAFANRAMASIGKEDPVFYKMVQTSLLGVHPCFLRLCAMAGRRTADDTIPRPNGVGGGAQRSRAEILFGAEMQRGLVKP